MKRSLKPIISASFLVAALSALPINLYSQTTFPTNGVTDIRPDCYALTNARITVKAGSTIENAIIVVRKGFIEAVGTNVVIPVDAVIINAKGKYIYPSFIELDSDYGMPQAQPQTPQSRRDDGPQMESNQRGAYGWNQALKTHIAASDIFTNNPKSAEEWRKMGFGAVQTYQHDGIIRGVSAVVALGENKENSTVLVPKAALQFSFSKGTSTQDYPESLMGAIALLRQTYYDAEWYRQAGNKEQYNISLETFNTYQNLPQIFEVNSKWHSLRADKIGDEFGIQYVLRGSGDEYERITDIKKTSATFIIPLNFPQAFDVEDPLEAQNISLSELKHWELAPTNPSVLEKNNVSFALTTALLKNKQEFWENVRTAIKYGLSKNTALEALTTVPARILRMDSQIGTLESGKIANFLVSSGDIFEKETIIFQNWVQGKPYTITELDVADIRGKYVIEAEKGQTFTIDVRGSITSPEAKLLVPAASDTLKPLEKPASLSRVSNSITIRFTTDSTSYPFRFSGIWSEGKITGEAQDPTGKWISWSAKKVAEYAPEAKKEVKDTIETLSQVTFPNGEFGWKTEPKPENVIIRNATLWTNTENGIQKNSDIVITNGKITAVGKNLPAPAGSLEIDGSGKHVSPGIIDEHSHIAISEGVNEGTQNNTAEVRIGDVLIPEDVNIYRQLAGGVIGSQLLHGSANPIGGQSAIVKLRWGKNAEELKIEGADGTIKFALGENVKQSNWGDKNVVRFPQTRMGVEQVYMDAFTRAKEYEQAIKSSQTIRGRSLVRRDLELDALVEIMNKKRFITCHSYVQSEITMLMRVAEKFGFKVNTFTHILEGYKVADKMKEHGVNASTFSDWWAYKHEVIEAIPFNGAILSGLGVNTSINSDDAEMARRLNQEAAKTVKYGGTSEEEALKMVTLNPAKMLHLDNRTGSLKVGNDADVVVWSDNPLSIYSRVEQTFVDGIRYFDIKRHEQMLQEINQERERIIRKMLDAKGKGKPVQKPVKKEQELYKCDKNHEHH